MNLTWCNITTGVSIMDHEVSIRTQAAEGYLLGDLPPAEREAFEQHYFECAECAQEVRLGFQFGENVKAEFRREARALGHAARRTRRAVWFAWLWPAGLAPAAACFALAVLAYQNLLEIPPLRARAGRLERPVALATTVLASASRGSLRSIAVSKSEPFFQLSLEIGELRPAGRYECALQDGSGKTIWTLPITGLNPGSNLNILIPATGVPTGSYDVLLLGITGRDAESLEHYRFAVRHD
jgi:hypothetical protein